MSWPHRQPATRGRTAVAVRRDEGGHLDWCARGHQCGMGEHRSEPMVVEVPTVGRMVVTRVQSRDGRQHVEVRGSAELDWREHVARGQLLRLLDGLAHVLSRR